MVDLQSQYQNIKEEIQVAMQKVLDSSSYIGGEIVNTFSSNLEKYLDVNHVIPCANGTDALQIALMALDLKPEDEIIAPSFTYVASAEIIALLGLKPVFCEVNADYFTIDIASLERCISPKTKAIICVHLYGQSADMENILALADKYNIPVIEDNAQAIGGNYTFSDGRKKANGTMGLISTTSFFPSKNLGAYGDGGALFCNDELLAKKIKMIANHGQSTRYVHDIVGCNSRLDSLQAAILNVKLPYLEKYNLARRKVADTYDKAFSNHSHIKIPARAPYAFHVFHQYTLSLKDIDRNEVQKLLSEKGIPSMIYYPIPCHKQKMFEQAAIRCDDLSITNTLTERVISLPMHSEMQEETQEFIIKNFLEIINKLI